MSCPSSNQWTPIFVSFIGDDVPEGFMSPLFEQLKQAGIDYFSHNETEDAGLIREILLKARFAIVVFSKRYTKSNKCLDELVEILNHKRYRNLVVIPIFCMDRAAVMGDGEFALALETVEETQKNAKKMEWRRALAEAEEISGYELRAANGLPSPDHSKLMKLIFERLVNEIHSLDLGEVFTFGPFGHNDGRHWHYYNINGIDVKYNEFIKSISFQVEDTIRTVPQPGKEDGVPQPGKEDGLRTYKVKLENGEKITSFAGYFKKSDNAIPRINFLKFRTNKRILGPIGMVKEQTKEAEEKMKYFSVPSKGGEVTEFFGRNNGFLTSIGARVKPHFEKLRPISVNSLGWIGAGVGSKWDSGNQHGNVRKIIVEFDPSKLASKQPFIRSIAFQYGENEELWPLETHGPMIGKEFHLIKKVIKMDPDEYLTSISGSWSYIDGYIQSVTFLTNEERIETIGVEEGINNKPTGGRIVGFYGWMRDGYLRGIGAYCEQELFGDGKPWEDKKFDGVREIHLLHDKNGIHCIKFVYDNRSEKGRTIIHGDCTKAVFGQINKVILYNYPREYLTSISGFTGNDGTIKWLTFYSNRRRLGCYGTVEDTNKGMYFWYPSTGSRITGFHGRCGETLKSIGVYTEPIPYMYPFKVKELSGGPRPFVGSGVVEWDDGGHTNVRAFRVTTCVAGEKQKIESITFKYDDNGSLVEGFRRGGGDPSSGEWIWLDSPSEHLTSISIWTGQYGDKTLITHLKLTTNQGRSYDKHYGPYPNTPTNSTERIIKKDYGHKITGFFGRMWGLHLISIGAHLEEN